MTTYLKITSGPKRSLGYSDENDSLDDGLKNEVSNVLIVVEGYAQHVIGTDVKDFYIPEGNKPLYTLVCNILAVFYMQNPVSVTSGAVANVDTVTNATTGQLGGRCVRELED